MENDDRVEKLISIQEWLESLPDWYRENAAVDLLMIAEAVIRGESYFPGCGE